MSGTHGTFYWNERMARDDLPFLVLFDGWNSFFPERVANWRVGLSSKLREQLETVVDRALSIATTEPRGPVYLSLPREVIAAPYPRREKSGPGRHRPAAPAAPDAAAVAAIADTLSHARRPLIITSAAGRDAAAFGRPYSAVAGRTARSSVRAPVLARPRRAPAGT